MNKLFKQASLIILWVCFPFLAQSDLCKTNPRKCQTEKETEQLEFVGSVSFLSAEEAQKIWSDIYSQITGLEKLCKVQKNKRSSQAGEWAGKIRQLGEAAGRAYRQHKYSFNEVKIRDGKKQVDLGIILLDMESILKSKYIQYNSGEEKLKACKDLKGGFTTAYASHYNLRDNVDVIKALSPWAGKIYFSLNCLCP